MRRLQIGQAVSVSVDDGSTDTVMDCRVLEVKGLAAAVKVREWPEREVDRAALRRGSASYLVFEHQGGMVALHGFAKIADEQRRHVGFAAVDRFQMPERRREPRVPMRLDAHVLPLVRPREPAAEGFASTTVDLSPAGAMLKGDFRVSPGERLNLELILPADQAPIRCAAEVRRTSPEGTGVELIDIDPADRIRLAVLLARFRERSL